MLASTPIENWYQLVREAELVAERPLVKDLENYLVNTLLDYTSKPDFVDALLAIDYLSSTSNGGSQRIVLLRDVGDRCLLFSGLYPEFAEQKMVSADYFVDVGQASYASVSELHQQPSLSQLFSELESEFHQLTGVLRCIRAMSEYDELLGNV